MKADEYLIFIKSALKTGISLEIADLHARQIDNMLETAKMRSIIISIKRRKQKGKKNIDNTVSNFIEEQLEAILKDENNTEFV